MSDEPFTYSIRMPDEPFTYFILVHDVPAGDAAGYPPTFGNLHVRYDTTTGKWSSLDALGYWVPLGLEYFTDPKVRLYRLGSWLTMEDVELGNIPPF